MMNAIQPNPYSSFNPNPTSDVSDSELDTDSDDTILLFSSVNFAPFARFAILRSSNSFLVIRVPKK